MKHLHVLVPITALLGSVVASADRQFTIRTSLKPNQPGKDRFNNLYLLATKASTGAGSNDPIFSPNPADIAATNGQNGATVVKAELQAVKDLKIKSNNEPSSEFIAFKDSAGRPIKMIMNVGAPELSDWQTVMLNGYNIADPTTEGFYMNDDGLQYENSSPINGVFGGWLVCEWYHDSKPQLFFRFAHQHAVKVPDSCADVNLLPLYS